MFNPPSLIGSDASILVPAGNDVVWATVGGSTDVLSVEVAPACRSVTIDGHLVVGNYVLAVVQRRQRLGDPSHDVINATAVAAETSEPVGSEDGSQVFELVAVDRPAVGVREPDDRSFVE